MTIPSRTSGRQAGNRDHSRQHQQSPHDELHEEIITRSPVSDAVARAIASELLREGLGGEHLAAIAAGERPPLHDALAEVDVVTTSTVADARRLALAALRRWIVCDGIRFDPALTNQQILDRHAWLDEFTSRTDSSPPDDWPT